MQPFFTPYTPTMGSFSFNTSIGNLPNRPLDYVGTISLLGDFSNDFINFQTGFLALSRYAVETTSHLDDALRASMRLGAIAGGTFVSAEFLARSWAGDESGAARSLVAGSAGLVGGSYVFNLVAGATASTSALPAFAAIFGTAVITYGAGVLLESGLPYVLPQRLPEDRNGQRSDDFTTLNGARRATLDTIFRSGLQDVRFDEFGRLPDAPPEQAPLNPLTQAGLQQLYTDTYDVEADSRAQRADGSVDTLPWFARHGGSLDYTTQTPGPLAPIGQQGALPYVAMQNLSGLSTDRPAPDPLRPYEVATPFAAARRKRHRTQQRIAAPRKFILSASAKRGGFCGGVNRKTGLSGDINLLSIDDIWRWKPYTCPDRHFTITDLHRERDLAELLDSRSTFFPDAKVSPRPLFSLPDQTSLCCMTV